MPPSLFGMPGGRTNCFRLGIGSGVERSADQGLGVYQSERGRENMTRLENYLSHSTSIFFAAYHDGVNYMILFQCYHLSSIAPTCFCGA
jgi:hypothetical protein